MHIIETLGMGRVHIQTTDDVYRYIVVELEGLKVIIIKLNGNLNLLTKKERF